METIVTPSAEHFTIEARQLSGHPQNQSRLFPDDEVYVQFESIDSVDSVSVVHSGQPAPNRGLAYLYGLLSLLNDENCSIELVLPYAPYSRQDAAFYEGTVNHAKTLLQTITQWYGVDRVYTVDPHFGHRDWMDDFPIEVLRAFPLIQEHVTMADYVVVGPDLGAVKRFGVPSFEKTRESAYDVELVGDLDVERKNVLVFDDLISTGGTMVEAYERLMAQGAATVQAAAVHGVLDKGVERVRDKYDALYLTNTIPNDAATVSIEPVLQNALEEEP
ncbi:ribose-phosphate diphosphokinase [Halostella sp. PRR32]|uniref:ribose-phosphate diphosphokinase n=1 Tax=Halostella sp. PRR32 TaxID=3098147 RepID=UPI002B1D5994|nr:ribose-phosphate diphosphokinase [Halostella sp. PRR32]